MDLTISVWDAKKKLEATGFYWASELNTLRRGFYGLRVDLRSSAKTVAVLDVTSMKVDLERITYLLAEANRWKEDHEHR